MSSETRHTAHYLPKPSHLSLTAFVVQTSDTLNDLYLYYSINLNGKLYTDFIVESVQVAGRSRQDYNIMLLIHSSVAKCELEHAECRLSVAISHVRI